MYVCQSARQPISHSSPPGGGGERGQAPNLPPTCGAEGGQAGGVAAEVVRSRQQHRQLDDGAGGRRVQRRQAVEALLAALIRVRRKAAARRGGRQRGVCVQKGMRGVQGYVRRHSGHAVQLRHGTASAPAPAPVHVGSKFQSQDPQRATRHHAAHSIRSDPHAALMRPLQGCGEEALGGIGKGQMRCTPACGRTHVPPRRQNAGMWHHPFSVRSTREHEGQLITRRHRMDCNPPRPSTPIRLPGSSPPPAGRLGLWVTVVAAL